MKGWRIILLLVLLVGGAATYWILRSQPGETAADDADPAQVAYDYEASDVVMRQMGPDGRMAFQIEAKQITQLPDSGRISVQGLTLYHDPPGTEIGGTNRLTLTADNGELPAESGVVTLTGKVRAHGIPRGKRSEMVITTESLRYDMNTQELSSDDSYRLTMGGFSAQGQGVKANLQTGEIKAGPLKGNLTPDDDADAR